MTELVLRGIFHLRKKEIDFYYQVRPTDRSIARETFTHSHTFTHTQCGQQGASFIYPDRWEAYRDAIPEDERHDFLSAYHKRLTSDDPNVRLPAALAWTTWERTTSNLIPPVRRCVFLSLDC